VAAAIARYFSAYLVGMVFAKNLGVPAQSAPDTNEELSQ
jgi:hypothetical protein